MNRKETDPDLLKYLAEFDHVTKFDDEDCPVCGIKISSTIEPIESFFGEIATFNTRKNAEKILIYLRENKIESIIEEIEKVVKLKVRVFDFDRAKKILLDFKSNLLL